MKLTEIHIRDPFILPYEGCYYMYGAHNKGDYLGFDVYKSYDLEDWTEAIPVFKASSEFWGKYDFWAPEVHLYNGRFYLFATFKSDTRHRGTQILVSDTPDGTFEVWSEVITPEDWECLDGTLYVEDGVPYMVFCHEWMQIKDGDVSAIRMTDDLKKAVGESVVLWKASDVSWVAAFDKPDSGDYITDGPFLFRDKENRLCSLWSSYSRNGYAIAMAYSDNGKLFGNWKQEQKPIFDEDGGHGMIFETFDGKKLLTIHKSNGAGGKERAIFIDFDI